MANIEISPEKQADLLQRWDTLSPKVQNALRRRGIEPKASSQALDDPHKSRLSAATPKDVSQALVQPPLPPRPPTWGQTALRTAPPIAAGIATAGLPRPVQAAATGAAAGLGEFLADAPLTPPDPRTDPIGAYNAQDAYKRGQRIGLETMGAVYGAGAVPYAPQGSGLLTRLGLGTSRALGAGAGAGAGSLAAEPLDPSGRPLSRARDVGTTTGALTGTGSLLGTIVPPVARTLFPGLSARLGVPKTPTVSEGGREAAETMAAEGVAIPSSVSDTKAHRMMEHVGERSLFGGTALARAWELGRQRLSEAVANVMDGLRQGRSREQIEAHTSLLYRTLDQLRDTAMQRPGRPVIATAAQQEAQTAQALFPPGSALSNPFYRRAYSLLQQLATGPDVRRYSQSQLLATEANMLASSGQFVGPAAQALRRVATALQEANDSGNVVDVRSMRPVFDRFRALAEDFQPGDPAKTLLTTLGRTPDALTFEEADILRSRLLQIGRQIPDEGLQAGQYRGSLRAVSRTMANDVHDALDRTSRQFGPDVYDAWATARQARRAQAQVATLGEVVRNSRDEATGVLHGRKLFDALADPETQRELEGYAPGQVQRIQQLARALMYHQERSGTGLTVETPLHRLQSHASEALGPLGIYGGSGALLYSGHPMAQVFGGLLAVMPDRFGYLLSNPRITAYMTLGMQMNPNTREYLQVVNSLVGALIAEGIEPAEARRLVTQPKAAPGQ